jgi:hypothetical protein
MCERVVTLAPTATVTKTIHTDETVTKQDCGSGVAYQGQGGCGSGNWCWFLVFFVLIFLVAWVLIASWRPHWVRHCDQNGQHTHELNGTKIVGCAFFAALVIVGIIWLICCICGSRRGGY